ncbi:MAG: SdpI family protein [Anaerolineales bacterium]|nr:SdpI family protein [Anaerolineales bacterium]WKZ40930.1 MAG: SdpI family protein [Anaerolineales bacterium]
MSTKLTTILVLILIAAAVIAGALFWDQLPESMASHWNENDQVDGYMSKFWGVWMMPLMVLGMFGIFLLVPVIDPLKANIAKFRNIFNLFILLITAFMLYIHGLTLAWNLGYEFRMSSAMLPFMGILFVFMGYMLRQAKRNWFIGIRTPWTLSSDTVWDKTHQLGSVLFIASGVLAFLGAFFGGTIALYLTLIPMLGSALFVVLYSFVLYQREMKGQ